MSTVDRRSWCTPARNRASGTATSRSRSTPRAGGEKSTPASSARPPERRERAPPDCDPPLSGRRTVKRGPLLNVAERVVGRDGLQKVALRVHLLDRVLRGVVDDRVPVGQPLHVAQDLVVDPRARLVGPHLCSCL